MAKRKHHKKRKYHHGKHLKKFIKKALTGKRGSLHKALHVPEGKKIPLVMLKKAAKKNTKVGHKARFALAMRSIRRKRSHKKK